MLQTIRDNSKGWIAKIIVGLIALTFALFGVESLVGLGSKEKPAATVNGQEITQQALFRQTELARRQILSQMGADADPTRIDENALNREILDMLIQETLLLQSAQQQGLYLSDQMIDEILVQTPDFQTDGRFDAQRFDMLIGSIGHTRLSFRDMLRTEILISQERDAYSLSAFVTPTEAERLIRIDGQTRDMAYLLLPLVEEMNRINISEEELQARYEAQAAQLQTREQVVLDYVLLEKNQFVDPALVSDEEVEQLWQQMRAEHTRTEEREAAHILIEVDGARTQTEALELAQALRARIEGGESFAELAETYSDDTVSATEGGYIGYQGRDTLVDEFAEALFALETGEVSVPVRSQFGYHLIQLQSVRESAPPALDEVAFELRMEIAEREAERLYVAALDQLADLSFSAADLTIPAEELNLTIEQSAPIAREGNTDFLGRQQRVVEAAFSQDVLRERLNSLPIELDRETAVVVRLNRHDPVRQLAFEEVREQLEMQLIGERARAALAEKAEAWLTALRTGEPVAELEGREWIEAQAIQRNYADAPQAVVHHLFAMTAPTDGASEFALVTLNDNYKALVRLDAVHPYAEPLSREDLALFARLMAQETGARDFQARVNSLRERAEIKRN